MSIGTSVDVDPASFFVDGNSRRLNTPFLVEWVEGPLTRVRVGPNGELFVYDDGRYVSGEVAVRAQVRRLLGPLWAPAYVHAVVTSFKDREGVDPLTYDPPGGRVIHACSGIIDVETRTFAPYTPENAWLVKTPYDYDPNAKGPEKIFAFLLQVLGSDEMVRHYLEIVGYALMTRTPLRKALLLRGAGRNGKSIMLFLTGRLLGDENVVALPLSRLGGEDRFAPARLRGKLANICGDIASSTARDMSLFKQITGGDTLYGETKGVDGFEFRPCTMLIFSANEYPGSPDTSAAYIDRWLVIDCPNQFPENAKMEAALKALVDDEGEMRGFMRLAVDAAHRLIRRGDFAPPAEARAAHAQFTQAVDNVSSFVASECRIGPDVRTDRDVAHRAYKDYCLENGLKPLGRNKFYQRMEKIEGVTRVMGRSNVESFSGLEIPLDALGGMLRSLTATM